MVISKAIKTKDKSAQEAPPEPVEPTPEQQLEIDRRYLKVSARFYNEHVQRVANGLRSIARTIERVGLVPDGEEDHHPLTGQRHSRFATAAANVQHEVIWGLANLHPDNLTTYAAEADRGVISTRMSERALEQKRAAEAEEEVCKPPIEWCIEMGVQVMDPDGWRGPGAPSWDEPITREEFVQRVSVSTVRTRTASADPDGA